MITARKIRATYRSEEQAVAAEYPPIGAVVYTYSTGRVPGHGNDFEGVWSDVQQLAVIKDYIYRCIEALEVEPEETGLLVKIFAKCDFGGACSCVYAVFFDDVIQYCPK